MRLNGEKRGEKNVELHYHHFSTSLFFLLLNPFFAQIKTQTRTPAATPPDELAPLLDALTADALDQMRVADDNDGEEEGQSSSWHRRLGGASLAQAVAAASSTSTADAGGENRRWVSAASGEGGSEALASLVSAACSLLRDAEPRVRHAAAGLLGALAAASSCRLLLVEGYLWELPGAAEAIGRAVDAARSGGALVAFTAGDAGVCERHRGSIVAALDCGMADVLFANRAEASALLGGGGAGKKEDEEENDSAALLIPADEAAALLASRVGVAIVTDGANGASICALGAKTTVPPVWGPLPPVDTNGAGDAFAAGAIYGLLRGYSVVDLGRAGARAAAAVIGRHGAAMSGDEAARVVEAVEAARAKEARSEWRRRVFGGAGAGEEISSSSSASVSSSPLMSVDEK